MTPTQLKRFMLTSGLVPSSERGDDAVRILWERYSRIVSRAQDRFGIAFHNLLELTFTTETDSLDVLETKSAAQIYFRHTGYPVFVFVPDTWEDVEQHFKTLITVETQPWASTNKPLKKRKSRKR